MVRDGIWFLAGCQIASLDIRSQNIRSCKKTGQRIRCFCPYNRKMIEVMADHDREGFLKGIFRMDNERSGSHGLPYGRAQSLPGPERLCIPVRDNPY